MNCDFKRKLPIPMEVKEMYPVTAQMEKTAKTEDPLTSLPSKTGMKERLKNG